MPPRERRPIVRTVEVKPGFISSEFGFSEVLREVGRKMREEEELSSLMIDDPQILGVDDFGDSQVTVKMPAKTVPLKQWEVARELRRRIWHAFDEKGIEIPFPQRTIYIRKEGS